ncbi:hypothetical protein VCHENC02_3471B, partial [Vibrio harveyi]
NSLVLLLQRFA